MGKRTEIHRLLEAEIGNFPNLRPLIRRQAMLEAVRAWSHSESSEKSLPFSYIDFYQFIPSFIKGEHFTTKIFKPPRYKDLKNGKFCSEAIKASFMPLYFLERGGYCTFAFSPSNDLIKAAKQNQKGFATYFFDRLSRYFAKELGRRVQLWFTVEATDHSYERLPVLKKDARTGKLYTPEHGRLHLHGALQISAAEAGVAKRALKAANPESLPFDSEYDLSPYQNTVEAAIGAAGYARKHLANTRRNHLSGQALFAADNRTKDQAEKLYRRMTKPPIPVNNDQTPLETFGVEKTKNPSDDRTIDDYLESRRKPKTLNDLTEAGQTELDIIVSGDS